jgi:hypothetical protein
MPVTSEKLHRYNQADVSKILTIDYTTLIMSNEEETT